MGALHLEVESKEGDTSGHCVIIADYRASFRHSGGKIELKFIKTGKVIELENGTH